jgi:hypothetical protein
MRLDGFEDLEEIGRGGFSTVYRARQLRPERIVAIKVLDLGVRGRAEKAAFERECNLSARLGDHPHALGVHSVGFDRDGHPYLVLQYCEGGSLNDRLARGDYFSVAEAAQIVVRVGSAISAAHRRGILHRDVKPANILIDGYGEPRLADFGLARLAEQVEGEHSLAMYTPLYAAPEQRLGEPVDEATDQYGLAVTLFALLEGRPPHPDAARPAGAAGLHRILTDGPPTVQRPDVLPELREVIRRGMATAPPDRFESVDAFTRAVSVAAGTPEAWSSVPKAFDEGQMTRPKTVTSPPAAAAEPARRRRWWPYAAATAVLLLAVAVVLARTGPSPSATPAATTTAAPPTSTGPSDPAAAALANVGPEYAPQQPALRDFGDGTVTFSWLPALVTLKGQAAPGVPYFSEGGSSPLRSLPTKGGVGSWSGAAPADAGCFYAMALYDAGPAGRVRVLSEPASYGGASCPRVPPSTVP